ncbi:MULTISPECIES: GTP-binding protein [unclassified Streptomyces]|uniref:GTP-binding protein n=1 Tax=unclassified Streptomyces TaxID=2593676 RepID=UPI0022B6854A|nr:MULTISPECIES: GTP-binding protein [unclassified Streptomyces]MCZ7414268.1 50S ribosome-binding GTPase [Streptomyces sp. WMMC897]MCZ7431286.1 50S ribosome-binding GTPase [Streptomyces sp. WMMC1477]
MSDVTGSPGETHEDGTGTTPAETGPQRWNDGLIARRARPCPVPVLDGGRGGGLAGPVPGAAAGTGLGAAAAPGPGVAPAAGPAGATAAAGAAPRSWPAAGTVSGSAVQFGTVSGAPAGSRPAGPPGPAPAPGPAPLAGPAPAPSAGGPGPHGSGVAGDPLPFAPEPAPVTPVPPAPGGPVGPEHQEEGPGPLPPNVTEPALPPETAGEAPQPPGLTPAAAGPLPQAPDEAPSPGDVRRTVGRESGLAERLNALRELVGLSRARLEAEELADVGRVLEAAEARGRLSREYTTVAIAGPTGSGKSTLFNAVAGAQLADAGVRRPTTSSPVACVWETTTDRTGAEGLLERLGVPVRARRRAHLRDASQLALRGLVLLDLPDHDSAVVEHREQVDRLLGLVDAVIWVVDPEKYADAVLHERYLKAFAAHAEVTLVVLNQTDRLGAEAAEEVLGDVRRVLDEDGMALGEHGEPGAEVLALSALTGEGVMELRSVLAELVSARTAAARRLAADVDLAMTGLRPVYITDGVQPPPGLTDRVRTDFEQRLGTAAGAAAVGRTAERTWLRHADRTCGTPWAGLAHWYARRRAERRGEPLGGPAAEEATEPGHPVARPVVAQAVRTLADDASRGLPEPWARTVREAAWRGAEGLPAALDEAVAGAGLPPQPARPRWWTAAAAGQAALLAVQCVGLGWLLGTLLGVFAVNPWVPAGLLSGGAVASPLLAWACRLVARAPAQEYGAAQEQRLRRLAAACGRTRVLEPVAAELLRYREVRGQYVIAAGGTDGG